MTRDNPSSVEFEREMRALMREAEAVQARSPALGSSLSFDERGARVSRAWSQSEAAIEIVRQLSEVVSILAERIKVLEDRTNNLEAIVVWLGDPP